MNAAVWGGNWEAYAGHIVNEQHSRTMIAHVVLLSTTLHKVHIIDQVSTFLHSSASISSTLISSLRPVAWILSTELLIITQTLCSPRWYHVKCRNMYILLILFPPHMMNSNWFDKPWNIEWVFLLMHPRYMKYKAECFKYILLLYWIIHQYIRCVFHGIPH